MNSKKLMVMLCVAISIAIGTGTQAYAANGVKRLQGHDRYGTCTAISKEGWSNKTSEIAVIASGSDFPDALSAAPLAKKYNAPIFLTTKDQLDNVSTSGDIKVSDELKRLQVKKVYIVGGAATITAKVEEDVKKLGITVERISGKDRYHTALEVAKQVGTEKGIVVTTGKKFPDALSISPIAAVKGMPILLVDKDSVDNDVITYLSDKAVPNTYVVGGTAAVSDAVMGKFKNSERITGADAFETNVNILNKFKDDLKYDTVYVATRNSFADALAGSAAAPLTASPIILTGDTASKATQDYISSKVENITEVKVLGGENAVKPAAVQKLLPNGFDLKELGKAAINALNIQSVESKSEIVIRVEANGLPDEIQSQLSPVLPLINNAKLNISTKSTSNKERTVAKSASDITVTSLLGNIDTGLYVDTDLTGTTPKIKEIVKVPSALALALPPQFAGKQYMVIDPLDMNTAVLPADAQAQAGAVDYSKIAELSSTIQKQLLQFLPKYLAQWNPDVSFVTKTGTTKITTPEGTKEAQCYTIKIDDAGLKQLITYTVNNFASNQDAMSFAKELMIYIVDTTNAPDKEQTIQEIEKSFSEVMKNPKEALKPFNDFMSAIKDFKILGSKGITETVYVADGYIVGQKGTIDFNINLKSLADVIKKLDPTVDAQSLADLKGIIKLGIDFDTVQYNINKDVKVDIPAVDSSNSFTFNDLMKAMTEASTTPAVQ